MAFLAEKMAKNSAASAPLELHMIWLVVFSPPLWKIWVRQLGWWHKPNINGKIKNGNQTTNQWWCKIAINWFQMDPTIMIKFVYPITFPMKKSSEEITLLRSSPKQIPNMFKPIKGWTTPKMRTSIPSGPVLFETLPAWPLLLRLSN